MPVDLAFKLRSNIQAQSSRLTVSDVSASLPLDSRSGSARRAAFQICFRRCSQALCVHRRAVVAAFCNGVEEGVGARSATASSCMYKNYLGEGENLLLRFFSS
ncbi:hypothetical protein C8R45DRAFT_1209897 [Mycena sanguinolenta]|nr:hypothetical protein C8R45DRAFT_1209897 [Mycena sanguinolenta]